MNQANKGALTDVLVHCRLHLEGHLGLTVKNRASWVSDFRQLVEMRNLGFLMHVHRKSRCSACPARRKSMLPGKEC